MIRPKQEIPGEFFDLDHYIGRVKALQKAAKKEHKKTYEVLLVRLLTAKEKRVPLLDIADELSDAVGNCRKGEPEAFQAYRRLAQAIRERRDLK